MNKSAVIGLGIALALLSGIAMAQVKIKPPDVNCPGPDPDGSANRCRVDVKVILTPISPAPPADPKVTCNINAPDVNLKSKPDKGRVVIVWDLPKDFEFCPVLGDGVFLVDPGHVGDEEFDDFGVPDDGVGNPTFKKCKNRFRMLAENSNAHTNKPYNYRLQFRRRSDNLICTADPFIKNG